MPIHYLEASSMKDLANKIQQSENKPGKWNDHERSFTIINIQKDGDKFCAILSDSVPLVRGDVRTWEQNSINTYEQKTLDVKVVGSVKVYQ